jgi:hypothetical protein
MRPDVASSFDAAKTPLLWMLEIERNHAKA